MKLSEASLTKARASSDPVVKELVEFYELIIKNSAYEAYILRKMYENNWHGELQEKQVELINIGKNAEVHDKAVDRAMKLFDGQLKFLNDTRAIWAMLLPAEQERAKSDERLTKSKDLAL